VRLLLLALALPAVTSAQDPLDIIRRATELDRRDTELSRSYTFYSARSGATWIPGAR
jgi:hypothetical protein